jgi:acetyl-CoA carboxylase carboxyl transferase subunit alpha
VPSSPGAAPASLPSSWTPSARTRPVSPLIRFGIIDEIVPEPVGGAHRDPKAAMQAVGNAVRGAFAKFKGLDGKTVRDMRRKKFLAIGRNLT